MTEILGSKVSTEGRVSIPVDIRYALNIQPGDRVLFVLDGTAVRLETARSLAESVGPHNTGGDAVDAGEAVREARDEDQARAGLTPDDRASDSPGAAEQDDFLASLLTTP
jgi:AbrB family looped-hinge helix DNA binding protein